MKNCCKILFIHLSSWKESMHTVHRTATSNSINHHWPYPLEIESFSVHLISIRWQKIRRPTTHTFVNIWTNSYRTRQIEKRASVQLMENINDSAYDFWTYMCDVLVTVCNCIFVFTYDLRIYGRSYVYECSNECVIFLSPVFFFTSNQSNFLIINDAHNGSSHTLCCYVMRRDEGIAQMRHSFIHTYV